MISPDMVVAHSAVARVAPRGHAPVYSLNNKTMVAVNVCAIQSRSTRDVDDRDKLKGGAASVISRNNDVWIYIVAYIPTGMTGGACCYYH